MKKHHLVLVSGLALFAMFFGAGNLIFPPTLGEMAGSATFPAILGFLLTGVGIVMLGVIATTKAGGNTEDLARHLGKGPGLVFSVLILLAIGPGLAIPRTAATTHEVLAGSLFPGLSPILSGVIFFVLTLLFTIKPSKVIDWIGKVLTPILLIALAIIIIRGILSPLGTPRPTEMTSVFTKSFVEGYQTMDVLAALCFTAVIIAGYAMNGIGEKSEQIRLTVKAAVLASVALSLIYAGLIYVGATTLSLNLPEHGRVKLLILISEQLLGRVGMAVLCVAMAMACLTTAIGLTTAVGNFFERVSAGRLKRIPVMLASTAFSLYFSIAGVDSIVAISAPILSALYPLAITLILLNLFPSVLDRKALHIGSAVGALIPGILTLVEACGVKLAFYQNFQAFFPESFQSFTWLIPVVVLALLGAFLNAAIFPADEARRKAKRARV